MPKRPSVSSNGKKDAAKITPRYLPPVWGVITVIVCFALLVWIYFTPMFLPTAILLAVATLLVAGELLGRMERSQRIFYGVYMIRSKFGLNLMDRLSKSAVWFWNGLADWGLVLGFGIFSYFLFRKQISKRMIIFGIISIFVILVFILPFSVLGLSFVNISQISSRLQGAQSVQIGALSYVGYVLYALSIIGGFSLYVIAALAYNALSILYAVVVAIVTSFTPTPNYVALGQSIPGVAPIIPGITIPLFAGLLSLVVLLAVHEFSHGVLARISKIKVKSSGALLFGIIPIGAFVEPDEKSIEKIKDQAQNRISSAGVASNMLLSILFFIPLILFFYFVLPGFQHNYVYIVSTVPNAPANGIIAPGAVVLKWNNYNITTLSDFKYAAAGDVPGATISVLTNEGAFMLKANDTGKIGVVVEQGAMMSGGVLGQAVSFFYTFFALSFLLNFLIAVVNYLPIPSFDGWRIFSTSIKNKKIVFAISAFVVACIVINILPWIWIG